MLYFNSQIEYLDYWKEQEEEEQRLESLMHLEYYDYEYDLLGGKNEQ